MEKKDEDTKEEKIIETNLKSDSAPETNLESETANPKEDVKQKQNKQLIYAVVLMVSVLIIMIAVPYSQNHLFNKFDYNGMKFSKVIYDKLPFYDTLLPFYSGPSAVASSGFVVQELTSEKKQIGEYVLSLRQDPRELNDIKVNLDINNITFVKNKIIYVTYNESDPICEHNIISAADLARFLYNFGGLEAEGALMNEDIAQAKKITYATCEVYPNNTVIKIIAGDESKITKVKNNCYELMYKDCKIQSVTNRFILSMAEGYMKTVANV